jgi:hypothetical protein
MFYFQHLLQQALAGINSTGIVPAITGIAYAILLVSFLLGLYQSALRGGDLQGLAVSAIKYVAVAIILANWSLVFQEINGTFDQISGFIAQASGAGDMFLSWMDQLRAQFSDNGFSTLLPAVSGTMAAITSALLTIAAYLIYALMVAVFAFFYVLYGSLLYVLGPLVLAWLPIAGIGQLGRSYVINLMVWNAWGVLYATFGSLITAIQFNRVEQIQTGGFLGGLFPGEADSAVLGLVSVFYALALGLIPFIAKHLVSGDVGSSASALVRAGAAAAGAIRSAAAGFEAGSGSSPGLAGSLGAGVGAAATGGGLSSSTSASISSGLPPPQPSFAESIRGGLRSALEVATPPPAPRSPGAGQGTLAVPVTAWQPGTARISRSQPAFRPSGTTETLAFHTGRLAAGAARGG